MQLLLQCDGHGPRLELMSQLLRQEPRKTELFTSLVHRVHLNYIGVRRTAKTVDDGDFHHLTDLAGFPPFRPTAESSPPH